MLLCFWKWDLVWLDKETKHARVVRCQGGHNADDILRRKYDTCDMYVILPYLFIHVRDFDITKSGSVPKGVPSGPPRDTNTGRPYDTRVICIYRPRYHPRLRHQRSVQ